MASVELNSENFEETVKNNNIVFVDFWASWCGPCKSFAPIYEEISEKYPDILFGKVNTEEQQELASHFQIRSIPTIMAIKETVIVFSQPGALPAGSFDELVQKLADLDMNKIREEIEKKEK